jgi:hypothetical protein
VTIAAMDLIARAHLADMRLTIVDGELRVTHSNFPAVFGDEHLPINVLLYPQHQLQNLSRHRCAWRYVGALCMASGPASRARGAQARRSRGSEAIEAEVTTTNDPGSSNEEDPMSETTLIPAEPGSPMNRSAEIAISWSRDGIGRVTLNGEHWASVEWSEKRQRWCVEDCEGRCLTHVASIRGQAASKDEAVALAEAMIRDGRMPSPLEASAKYEERRRIAREKRAARPSEQRRKAEREAERAAFWRAWEARRRDEEAQPFIEALDEAFNLTDPELWKSNSFASLKPRLIIHLEAEVARLESERFDRWRGNDPRRLERARVILAVLKQ